jgi:hypothetical protein
MWQQMIIIVTVLCATGYVTWTFLSMDARQQLLDWLASRRLFVGLARRHRARMSAPGCSNCAASSPVRKVGSLEP